MSAQETQAGTRTAHVLEIRLADGEELHARLAGDPAAELASLHARLESDAFVFVGEDTVVRSSEVRYVRLTGGRPREREMPMGTYDAERSTQVRGGAQHPGYPVQHHDGGHWGYNQPWSETKPFFLTSEFLTLIATIAAIALAMVFTDNLPDPRGWTLIAALSIAYIVSRGIAKAGSRPRYGRDGY